jgi:hypothetical protein
MSIFDTFLNQQIVLYKNEIDLSFPKSPTITPPTQRVNIKYIIDKNLFYTLYDHIYKLNSQSSSNVNRSNYIDIDYIEYCAFFIYKKLGGKYLVEHCDL